MGRALKVCRKISVLCLEVFLVLVLLAALGTGILIWRVRSQPLSIDFAKVAVETALSDEATGRFVKIGDVSVHWPRFRGPLQLKLGRIKLLDAQDHPFFSINKASISIARKPLLWGQVAPVDVVIEKPELRIVRAKDGAINIGFKTDMAAASSEQSFADDSDIAATILGMIPPPSNDDQASSMFSALQKISIQNGYIELQDQINDGAWVLPDTSLYIENQYDGLSAHLSAQMQGYRDGNGLVSLDVFLSRETQDISFQSRIHRFDPVRFADDIKELGMFQNQKLMISAMIKGRLERDLMPRDIELVVQSPQGEINVSELSHTPISYSGLEVSAIYASQDKRLQVQNGQMSLHKQVDGEERSFDFAFEGSAVLGGDDVSGALKLEIPRVAHSTVEVFWPEVLREENAREWIVEKMSDGVFSDLSATLDFRAFETQDEGWDFSTSHEMAYFSFEDMGVRYRDPMAPVKGAKGSGYFDNAQEKLEVSISKGSIGGMQVKSATLEFVEIMAKGRGIADISVDLSGDVADVIRYVRSDPINFDRDFDMGRVQGKADLWVNVVFPTVPDIKTKDVNIMVQGKARDILLPGLVKEMDLTGGPFEVSVLGNRFKASGKGALFGRPVSAKYDAFLESEGKPYKSKVSFNTRVDHDMRWKLGLDLGFFLEDSVTVKGTYTEFRDETAKAEVEMDLEPARLFIDPLLYEKPVSGQGKASLVAEFGKKGLSRVYDIDVTAAGLAIRKGELSFRNTGGDVSLSGGSVQSVRVGESRGSLNFERDAKGQVDLKGHARILDMRPFLASHDPGEPSDGIPMTLSMTADTILSEDTRPMKRGKFYVDLDEKGRFNQFEVDVYTGQTPIYVRYKPDEKGQRNFYLETEDAGAAFRAIGLTSQVVGGKLMIYAEPLGAYYQRDLSGAAEISDFKVVNAPGLARLLGALSLNGVLGLLEGGDGLEFSRLETDFDWSYKPEGSVLTFYNGRTSGNSLGLTFDGTYNKADSKVDLTGTIVPLSGINKFVSKIPLLGNIIAGGTGSIFAATYSMKGVGQDAVVSVNPLSVLAPGILRRILFERDSEPERRKEKK